VVKTKVASTLVDNFDQTFKALNKFQWKLNPKKCIFGVSSCILLGNIVSREGIQPNPEKVKAVMKMKLLKAKEKFEWSEEANTTFAELKQFLTSPLVLTAPKEGETLLLYIAATNRVVSTAIVVEREEVRHVYKVQRPVYFISEVLNKSKSRYPQV
jgi:hypothetical protein